MRSSERRCASHSVGSGRSSCSSISDSFALPAKIASMMSVANNANRRIRLL
jgi:hypothetical protein